MKYVYWQAIGEPYVTMNIPWKYEELFGSDETSLLGATIANAILNQEVRK